MFLYRGHIGKDSAPFDFAAPAAILASCAMDSRFLRFYHRRSFPVKLYIYSNFCVIYTVLAGLHTPFPLPVLCVFHSRTDILLCCSSPLLFCCVSIAFLRFGLCFGHLTVAVMLFRAVFHLMSWASLWAYVCSPFASIRLTFPFSAHKQSTTSPCTLLVSLPFRSDPMILRRKRFPTFQRQSIALCFNHHSDSLEC